MTDARRQRRPGRRIGILASRLRREEKAILAALEARGIVAEQLDPRTLHVSSDAAWTGPSLVVNREIGHFRRPVRRELARAGGRDGRQQRRCDAGVR